MEFVLIPPGTYQRGTSEKEVERLLTLVKDSKREWFENETPQAAVTITRPFYMAKYAVTQEQYKAVMGKNPSHFSSGGIGMEMVAGMDTSRFPVEAVSWKDAVAFCETVGKKLCLPREAEWEYACRAGTETFFHFGDKLNGDSANCEGIVPFGTDEKGEFLQRTRKVGSYAANAFGLYDMHGNVWQWCEDYYGPYSDLKDRDPVRLEKDKEDHRVLRGGSWGGSARNCRAASRHWNEKPGIPQRPGFRPAPACTDLHYALWLCYSLPFRAERGAGPKLYLFAML